MAKTIAWLPPNHSQTPVSILHLVQAKVALFQYVLMLIWSVSQQWTFARGIKL